MPSLSGTVYIGSSASKKEDKVEGGLLSKNENIKLNELEKRAQMVIFEAQSLRPLFSKYKDKITICLNRVTITKGSLFSGEEYPMSIENITGARVYRRMMFGTLEIDTFGVVKPDPITNMRINDARLARRYILALIECKKANIDLNSLDLSELRTKLKNIGMVRFTTAINEYHKL